MGANKRLPVGRSLLLSRSFSLDRFRPVGEGNGLQFRIRVGAGGHNNIEINPVFRGML